MDVRRALALTVVLPLLLTGCTEDDPAPKMPDPPPTSSSTPSPSVSETPEAESAEDFIRRWVEIDRRMQSSGDIAEYSEVSSRCRSCMSVARRVDGIFRAGGFVKTEGLMIAKLTDQSGERGRRVIDIEVRSTPTVIKESAGADEQRLPGGRVTYRLRLTPQAPWLVLQLTQLAS